MIVYVLNQSVYLIGSVPGRYPSEKKIFGHLRLRKVNYFLVKNEILSVKCENII